MLGEARRIRKWGEEFLPAGLLAVLAVAFVLSIAVRPTGAEIFEKKRYRVYKEKYARGEIIVKFKADAAMGERKKLHRRFGARVKRVISNIHAHKLAPRRLYQFGVEKI